MAFKKAMNTFMSCMRSICLAEFCYIKYNGSHIRGILKGVGFMLEQEFYTV